MMERRQIVAVWETGTAEVLVTLVRCEGSSYRRPGARLLLAAGGRYAGAISGGCLEAEVVRKAAWMVRDGAVVERYSTMFDDTAEIPFGLGCGGVVDLLLEPMGTAEATALMEALQRSLRGEESVVATWLPSGTKGLRRAVLAGGEVIFASNGLSAAELARIDPEQAILEAEGVFVERISPPQRLLVLGAGDDAKPVVKMASMLGWRVVVADGRSHLARPERFPEAERVVAAASAEELGITSSDAVVLMTHSYEQDRDLLRGVLPMRPGYLGLLGARHRSSLLISEAAAMLGWTVEQACEGMFAPMGLDLGGDGAEVIALAVIAEVQAASAGRVGISRRLTSEDVALNVARGGASRYLQTQCAL